MNLTGSNITGTKPDAAKPHPVLLSDQRRKALEIPKLSAKFGQFSQTLLKKKQFSGANFVILLSF